MNKLGQHQLFFRRWEIADPKSIVCLVHGIGEHIGRYEHVAKFMNERGFAVIGFDHQGHGQSPGKRGHAEGLESMLNDIFNLLATAKELHPGLPIFLYGHSMGGNLVLNYLLRRKPQLAGLISTAPWIRLPKPPSPFLVAFAKIACWLAPSFTQSNGLDVNGLSKDTSVVEAYLADPLVHDRISAKMGAELLAGANWLDRFIGHAPCPTLLMHGTEDPITSPAGTADFAKRLQGEVTWKPWPGLKHEIHNEPEQAAVLAFATEWMGRFC